MGILLSTQGTHEDVEPMAALARFDAVAAVATECEAPLARVMPNGIRQ